MDLRHIDLSRRDVWQLRNGSMVLRDGLLIVPENGKLRFLSAEPTGSVERESIGELDISTIQ